MAEADGSKPPIVQHIGGIPVDDAKNRAYWDRMGCGDIRWPAPYKDSVRMTCADCGGKVWIGPQLQKARELLVAEGTPPVVLCLLCAAAAGAGALRPYIAIALTDKQEGE